MIRREEGRKKVRIHIVQKGDTLWKIAKEYGISFEDLKRLNVHLANPDYIVPGMEIILPERTHKETHVPPKHHVKEGVKKEVPKPSAPSVPAPTPHRRDRCQCRAANDPNTFPNANAMRATTQPPKMWMQQPLEMNWNQQLIMPQMEQPVLPPIHIQPAPLPARQYHRQLSNQHHRQHQHLHHQCRSCRADATDAELSELSPTANAYHATLFELPSTDAPSDVLANAANDASKCRCQCHVPQCRCHHANAITNAQMPMPQGRTNANAVTRGTILNACL